jgi:hypothetical protein
MNEAVPLNKLLVYCLLTLQQAIAVLTYED